MGNSFLLSFFLFPPILFSVLQVSKYVERSLGNISERLAKIEEKLGITVDLGSYSA
jgi:hypothetical protein